MSTQPVDGSPSHGSLSANIARVVKLLAGARGMSIPTIGMSIGHSRTGIYNRLNGVTEWSAMDIARLAAALKVDPAVFYRPVSELLSLPGEPVSDQIAFGLSREHEDPGEARFSGSDINAIVDALPRQKVTAA